MDSEEDVSHTTAPSNNLLSLSYQQNVVREHRKWAAQHQGPVSRLAAKRKTSVGSQIFQLPPYPQHPQESAGPGANNDQIALKRKESMKSAIAFEATHINEQEDKEEKDLKGRRNEILRTASPLRRQIYDLIESVLFTGFILTVILLNTAIMCALTFRIVTVRAGWYFLFLDYIFMVIYLLECILKIYVWRLDYFKEQWNIIDFVIIVSNIADFVMDTFIGGEIHFLAILGIFRSMRALKALRLLRTVRCLHSLQVIMTTCLQSVQSMGAIVMLISLFLYMFAVIGRGLYAEVDPNRFGNLGTAAMTLFQLLTLDDWFYIYTDAVEKDPHNYHIILYLTMYIALEYFIFLNLFVAVLVDNFQLTLDAATKREIERKAAVKAAEDAMFDDGYPSHQHYEVESTSTLSASGDVNIKTIDDYYGEEEYSFSEKQYLGHFFQLLASLEQNGHVMRNQQGTLEKVVDLVQDTVDDA